MKILVTGASGFLGKFLCQALEKEGHELTEVHSKNCNLTQEHSLHQFNSTSFDQIFHLAAWTQAGDFCLRHPGEQWLINQKINTHVLSWWQQHQPQAKLICIGTSCSYDPALPLSEEYYLQGTPISSLYTYALTKRMLLVGLQALHQQFGLDYLYVIPSTLYGPYYHTDRRQLHFIFDLIRKILRKQLYGETVTLWGDGTQKRELIYVSDFVKALLFLNQSQKNTWFNIGSGKEHSIQEFAQQICELTDPRIFSEIQYDLSKYVGARSKVLQINKLKTHVSSFHPLDLKEGLKETIAWFLEQKENLLPLSTGPFL